MIPGSGKPFEEVRAELEAEYLESERERVFNDLSGKLVDTIYDDPTALAPAAAEARASGEAHRLFSRATRARASLPCEPVREAAFEDAQKIERQVSDPIEIEPNHVVVVCT